MDERVEVVQQAWLRANRVPLSESVIEEVLAALDTYEREHPTEIRLRYLREAKAFLRGEYDEPESAERADELSERVAESHDYRLLGFDLTWRDGAYRVSVPALLKDGERMHVMPASVAENGFRLACSLREETVDLRAENSKLRERVKELMETLNEALAYVPEYFREKWDLDAALQSSEDGASDA